MVYKYIRKSSQAKWSEDSLRNAVNDVKNNGESINSVARKYGIPFSTLQRHVKSGNVQKKLGRFVPIFTKEQELDLCKYVKELDGLFFGVTRVDFLKLANDYATKNKIRNPFKNGLAGEDWFARFKQRHPEIVLRALEPTSVARARGFNRPQVERFYAILWEQIEKHNIDVTSIYNMDETGVRTSSSKPPKILSIKGKKQVGVISSAERGQLTTVICCCNAAGSYVPPYFIFARKRMQERLLDGAPRGSRASVTDNGWINGPTFLLWLQFFVEEVRPKDDRKILLLLDNHEAHKYFPALEYATANNVVLVSFAPHTTNKMQPLDVCVYGPIKKYFEQELSSFQKSHPGKIINQYDIAKLFAGAYVKGASVQNAIQGFTKPGIWPYNPHKFGDEEYAPATMTDRPMEETIGNASSNIQGDITILEDNVQVTQKAPTDMSDHPVGETIGSSSLKTQSNITITEDGAEATEEAGISLEAAGSSTPPSHATAMEIYSFPPTSSKQADLPEKIISPFDIRPIPKMAAPKTTRRNKSQKAELLTSTPVKNEQKMRFLKVKKSKIKEIASQKRVSCGTAGTKAKKPSKTIKKDKKNYLCLVCSEEYEEPAYEDWIQCSQCNGWAHEGCTSYSGIGSYFCDDCQD